MARDGEQRIYDRRISGAAAQIAGEGLAGRALGDLTAGAQERLAAHNLARGAEAALKATEIGERPAQVIGLQTLDGGDRPGGVPDEDHAGQHCPGPEQDGARAALAAAAPLLRTGQPEFVPEHVEQGDVIDTADGDELLVDLQGVLAPRVLLPTAAVARRRPTRAAAPRG
jgi:hypothetical protein